MYLARMGYFLYGSDPENDLLTFSVSTALPDYGVGYTFVAPNKIVMFPPPSSIGYYYCIDA